VDALLQALRKYQEFDPAGWVALYRVLPMWAGIVLVGLGLTLLLFGGGRAFRLVAGPVGALIGVAWTSVLASKLGFTELDPRLPSLVAAVLAVAGFLFPPLIVFLGVGIPLGMVAGRIAGPSEFLLGFIPTFLIGGVVAAILSRLVGAVVASVVGAWLLVIGALSALHSFGGLVTAVANQPWGVIIAAGLFALAGSVYQIAVRPSPEEADRIRAEKARLKMRRNEQKALERRWGVK
jgi:hypothetical protein